MNAVEGAGELSGAGALAAIDALGYGPIMVLGAAAIDVNGDGDSWSFQGAGWTLEVDGKAMHLVPGVLRIGEDVELRASVYSEDE